MARRHWIFALGAAAMAHAALGAAMLWQVSPSSARSAGIGGIEVSLGPTGGAAGSVAEVPPPIEKETPVEEKPEPVAAPEPPRAPFEEPPVEEPDVAVQQDKIAPPPPPIDLPKEIPEPTPPQPLTAPTPPKPKPRLLEPPKKIAKPEPQKTPPREPDRSVVEQQTASVAPSVAGVNGKAGTEASQNAGDANDTAGGGMPGQIVDYMSLLQAWLEKHKEYPRGARLRRMEGTTLLYFVMDRNGRVLDFRIQKSSGHNLLDHEVEEMIQRAQPLPQMPDSMTQARLELVVPVQFLLR